MAPRKAVYAGTFDPITIGHKDIVERALRIFDQLVIAVAEKTDKATLFSLAERVELVSGAVDDLDRNFEVVGFDTLLVDFVKRIGANTIIRGLRAISDYEYEAQIALINRRLNPDIETVFLMTSEHCSFVSSSIVRRIAQYGGDVSSLVPANVARQLAALAGSK